MLKRRTLPWERNPAGSAAVSTTPWLALVVVAEGEAELSGATPVADCVTAGTPLHLPGDKDVEQGVYLAVTETVVKKIFPTIADLALLTHVREVDIAGTAHRVHRDRRSGALADAARRGEVIGVGVGFDHVAQRQPFAGDKAESTVDLAQRRVDHRAGAALGAADQVGAAPLVGDGMEDHGPSRCSATAMVAPIPGGTQARR